MPSGVMLIFCIQTSGVVNNYMCITYMLVFGCVCKSVVLKLMVSLVWETKFPHVFNKLRTLGRIIQSS